jgi:DNA primase
MFGIERLICGLCVRYPHLLDRHIERVSRLGFSDALHARFRTEICRVASDYDKLSVADFYESLDDTFYQILGEVMQNGDQNGGTGLGSFSELAQRFPLLRKDPPDDFIEAVFLHFLDSLELIALEHELKQELDAAEVELNEGAWNRIRGLTQDLARRREECAREEAELAERAKKLRSAPPVAAQGLS